MKKNILTIVILLALTQGCHQKVSKMEAKKESVSVDIQGHRGCRGLMPENTIPAMIKALEHGVQTLEMDVVITKDSQVILSHEPFFNHEIATKPDGSLVSETEEKNLNIFKMDFEEVVRYDVGMATHPRFPEQKKLATSKPLLKDVIDSVKKWCSEQGRPIPYFNIETKCMPQTDGIYHPSPAVFTDLLISIILDAGIEEKAIIQSFDFRTLQYAHTKYPALKLAALIEENDPYKLLKHIDLLGFTPHIYSPAWELVDTTMVSACKKNGMQLIPWTVNDTATAKKLIQLGVDGIITDYPDRVK